MNKLTILSASLALCLAACGGGGGGSDLGGGGSGYIPEAGVSRNGGMITVSDPKSPIFGTQLTVPSDAVSNGAVAINIEYENTAPAALHPDAIKAGAVIASKTFVITQSRPGSFDKPVEIKVPYDAKSLIAGAEPVVLAWNEGSKSYNAVTVLSHDEKTGFVTFHVAHLGRFVVAGFKANTTAKIAGSSVNTNAVAASSIDTGFRPERDGWFITNYGNLNGSAGGDCFGMASYAKWYFQYFKSNPAKKGLYLDYQEGNKADPLDDVTAIEIVDRVQMSAYGSFFKTPLALLAQKYSNNYQLAFDDLVAKLNISRNPQIFYLNWQNEKNESEAHAVLVYSFDANTNTFGIYDPNYPGKTQTIKYDKALGFKNYTGIPLNYKLVRAFADTDGTLFSEKDLKELHDGASKGWAESLYGKIVLHTPNIIWSKGRNVAIVNDFNNVDFQVSTSNSQLDNLNIRLNEDYVTTRSKSTGFNFNTANFPAWWPGVDLNQKDEHSLLFSEYGVRTDNIGRRLNPIYGAFKRVVMTKQSLPIDIEGQIEAVGQNKTYKLDAPCAALWWAGKDGENSCWVILPNELSNINISAFYGFPTINFMDGFVITPTAGKFSIYSNLTIDFTAQLANHRKVSFDFIPHVSSRFSNTPPPNDAKIANYYMPIPLDFEVYIEESNNSNTRTKVFTRKYDDAWYQSAQPSRNSFYTFDGYTSSKSPFRFTKNWEHLNLDIPAAFRNKKVKFTIGFPSYILGDLSGGVFLDNIKVE